MVNQGSRLKVGMAVGKLVGRRLWGSRVGDKDIELGDVLTRELDQMKGLAMKLGQIVSYMDVPLPDVVQERMARLQAGMNGLSEEETRAALTAAWGANFLEHFEAFDMKPFAAASIGQVHHARYRGKDVVVKLQYPQVAQGFRDDLHSIGRVASLASLASAVDGKAIVRELGERLSEECDYQKEAQWQSAFRRAFSHDADIIIPEVLPALSTPTTLATVWAEGLDYRSAAAFLERTRLQLGQALIRFSYGSLLGLCTIQADPHPGNFKFTSEGRVICLDFGCVRAFDTGFIQLLRDMILAIDRQNQARFREVVIELGMAPRPAKFDFDHYFAMMEHLHRPLLASSFRFTPDFVKAGLAYNGPSNPNARTMNMPPAYVWVARLQWGLWSLLTRLGAEVRARPYVEQLLASPLAPLSIDAKPEAL